MTDTVGVASHTRVADTTTAAARAPLERLGDALADHLRPRSIGVTGGVLLGLGLGYTWATLLFLQAHRTQLVVSYGLPALVLTVTGVLGLVLARRATAGTRGATTARWRPGLRRHRIRSSVRTGPPAVEHIDAGDDRSGDREESPDRAVVVRDRTPDAEPPPPRGPVRRPAPSPIPRPAPSPLPRSAPSVTASPTVTALTSMTAVVDGGPPEVPVSRGRHAWRDEQPDEPHALAADPTAPLVRAAVDPAPELTPELTPEIAPDPVPETTPQTTPLPMATPRTVAVRAAPQGPAEQPAEQVTRAPHEETPDEVASDEVASATSPRVARVRPARKSGGAASRPKRTLRVAGRPSTS